MRYRTLLFVLVAVSFGHGQAAPSRPPITGISHVSFYSSNPEAAKKFYGGLLGLAVEPPGSNDYQVGIQSVELEPLPAGHGHDLVAHLACENIWLIMASRFPPSPMLRAAGRYGSP